MTAANPGVTTADQARDQWIGMERSGRATYLAKTDQARKDLMNDTYANPVAYRAAERKAFDRYNEFSKAAWSIYQETLDELVGGDRSGVLPLNEPVPPDRMDPSDERQETYLAADPTERSAH
jgi:hypothetical protein